MFKLLTDKEKQKVVREYMMRRTIVILCAVVVVLVVGVIGLLPSYVLSSARENEAEEDAKMMDGGMASNETELQHWLSKTVHKLQLLSPSLDTDRPSFFIEKVLEQDVPGLEITNFSWTKEKAGDKVVLTVEGVALDRKTLIEFENKINSSKYFSGVVLPISNLAKDKDIKFQIKFSPAKTQ